MYLVAKTKPRGLGAKSFSLSNINYISETSADLELMETIQPTKLVAKLSYLFIFKNEYLTQHS